ncbi:hypothetical protein [Wolbachia endosymbiont (group B) of Longitarsus flavicornis]|uniref:WD_0033/WD_0034 family tandem repeat-containing protein n=1 Tax=Wolbachia endosymbiont (group B) of Longitarsus flavicornis TaxID=3066135 RepID=UPI003342C66F
MLNHQNLTRKQKDLYFQLKRAIWNRKSINNILEAASENDLLKVLTVGYTTRFPRGGGRTLTLLNLAIYKDNNESVDLILTHSNNKGILQEILKTSSTMNYTIRGYTYTLTPLAFAIHRSNNECINSILMQAQYSGILHNILASKDIVQFPGLTYIITPLNFAIYKGNNECINSILIRAQNSGILHNILTSKDIMQFPSLTYVIKPLAFAIYKGNNECINSILIQARNSGILQEVFIAVSTVLSPYVEYTLNAFELSVVIHQNGTNVRTALDNVSILIDYKKIEELNQCPFNRVAKKPSINNVVTVLLLLSCK